MLNGKLSLAGRGLKNLYLTLCSVLAPGSGAAACGGDGATAGVALREAAGIELIGAVGRGGTAVGVVGMGPAVGEAGGGVGCAGADAGAGAGAAASGANLVAGAPTILHKWIDLTVFSTIFLKVSLESTSSLQEKKKNCP